MMATSFSPHPGGMPQHPGAPPGHPMAPGMAHNPSQPGAQPGGMPHQLVGHMGVSGPAGPMNPAALMGGMQPGAGGPNAHTMQQLNSAQAQLFQNPHLNPMAFANNPNFQQQMQQQRLQQLQHQQQQQQQQQRQFLAQQAYNNIGAGGMPMGLPMQQMSAAHMAAMRRSLAPPGQHNNAHTHPALLHQLALQQSAGNQLGQPGAHPNQGPMNGPHLQGIQQAQLAAALQAQQAAQAQAQQAQGQPSQPHQPPGQPQQQLPQGPGQGGPGANLGPQNQGQGHGPTPQPNPQQQPQVPPQGPHPHSIQQAQLAAQAAHQNAVAVSLMQQKHREELKGHCLLKLLQFGEHLSGFLGSKGRDDLSYWDEFVQRFFSPRAIFRYGIHVIDGDEQSERQFDITYPALARYFHTHFDSGVKNIQLIMEKGTRDRPLPNDYHFIENTKTSLVYWFENGSHLVATGTLRAQFDSEQKFELFEFLTTSREEYISRRLVIQAAKPAHDWVKEWKNLNSTDGKQSPEMSKKGKARQMKSPQNPPPDLDLPQSAINEKVGITKAVHQFLEMVEIMGQMNPLFGYFHANPGLPPYAVLEQYVNQLNASGQGMVNGQPMGQAGPRTPGFGQFPMGASPAPVHQMLPGSPHVGSPAQAHMQAPGMQLQASQQGTSSSGPSANTSPSQSNKRRRPSTVKNEEDGVPGSGAVASAASTPQVNGVQPKTKPPTPRMPKRVKGNPA
ncbi:hypothetical protein VTK73DRAFT_9086 [Phialemonium thermophilum]|uniref:LIM-domain binding protein n=1 Tax=Phialemonium thermophilum TaxID=223376 RepID=A0ABR3XLJ2_9PEZI